MNKGDSALSLRLCRRTSTKYSLQILLHYYFSDGLDTLTGALRTVSCIQESAVVSRQ
jgi:hypothetical protein